MAANILMGILMFGFIGALVSGGFALITAGGSAVVSGGIIGIVLGGLFGIWVGVIKHRREEYARRTGLPYETVRRMHNQAVRDSFRNDRNAQD